MKDVLTGLFWWIVVPLLSWAAILCSLASLASAELVIVEMDDQQKSIAVVQYGEGGDFVDLQWEQGNNYGACANGEPYAIAVSPEHELVTFEINGTAGFMDSCNAFFNEPNAEIIFRTDSIEMQFFRGEFLKRRHLGRVIWDPIPGDANLDGVFNSSDLVQVMQAGQYEAQGVSYGNWYSGDWNMDRRFTSSDLIEAFVAGHYEQPTAVVASVPEPSALVLFALGCMLAWRKR